MAEADLTPLNIPGSHDNAWCNILEKKMQLL
jgi:hypothetical protein